MTYQFVSVEPEIMSTVSVYFVQNEKKKLTL